jgi:hypothetical protein
VHYILLVLNKVEGHVNKMFHPQSSLMEHELCLTN